MNRSWDLFSLNRRRTILRLSAIGVICYSFIVLIFANIVPDLGLMTLGRTVQRVSEQPVLGRSPQTGDIVESIAGVKIDSLPSYVSTISRLRDAKRFPAAQVSSMEELASIPGDVAQGVDGSRYVRIVFRHHEPAGSTSTDDQSGTPSTVASASTQTQFASWFEVRDLPWYTSVVSIAWFAMESLIFWIGWLVFRRRPEDDSAALFFLMCIVTVGAYMGGYHWLQIASSPALTFVFALCAMALPQVSLHFYLEFPKRNALLERKPRLVFWLLYGFPSILQLAILLTIGRVVSTFRHDLPAADIDWYLGLLANLILGYLGLAVLLLSGCVACLIHSVRTADQIVHRKQVRWLLFGMLASGVFVGYSFANAIFLPVNFVLGGGTWPMFAASFIMTTCFAVAIGRYRLLHAPEVVERGLVYIGISFVGGVLYYGLALLTMWGVPRLTTDSSQNQPLMITSFVLLVLISLTTIRSWMKQVVDRRFFREKFQLDRAMQRMDEAVGSMVDRPTLLKRSLVILSEFLNAEEAAAYFRHNDGEPFSLCEQIGTRAFPLQISENDEVVMLLSEGRLLQSNPGPVLPGDQSTWLLRRLSVEIAQPFLLDQTLVGFLVFGGRREGMYSSDDLGFLSGMSELTQIALRSAQTHETLEALNDELREKVARISRQHRQLLTIHSQVARRYEEESNQNSEGPAELPAVNFDGIQGSSPAIAELIETVRKVSQSSSTVLIRGESGTGKTLLAESIHRNSARANGPFVKVHCAALAPSLLESELFGHVKGAFTGAHRDKVGRFQLANGGSLFLDEVGDLSLDIQTKLLRVLQERTFEPVGASESINVDVRIIAATHQPLEQFIRDSRFREDLFYRLNVISIRTPALRERREDIFELSLHFLQKFAARSGKALTQLDEEVIEQLMMYEWPGNIRELENVVERAVVMATGSSITLSDLPRDVVDAPSRPMIGGKLGGPARPATPYWDGSTDGALGEPGDAPSRSLSVIAADDWEQGAEPDPLSSAATWRGSKPDLPRRTSPSDERAPAVRPLTHEMDQLEKQRLLDALKAGEGNKSRAAQILGIPRSTFRSKLKKYGIEA